jgi:hypothetical protein
MLVGSVVNLTAGVSRVKISAVLLLLCRVLFPGVRQGTFIVMLIVFFFSQFIKLFILYF